MKQNNIDHHIKLRTIIVLIIITAIVSGLTSGVIVYSSYSKNAGISYKSINEDKSLKEFLEVYSQVSNEYYEDVNKSELIKVAISAMLNYLDDNYTTYLDSTQTRLLEQSLQGTYRGIGVYISDKKIVEIFKSSPAEAAGLQVNDEIIKVNNKDVTSMESEDVANMIKQSNDKEVLITVKRNDETIDVTVKLSFLDVPATTSKIIENTSIGYIGVSTFSSSVARQIENELKDFESKKISGLILDLRSNNGGYLSSAEEVANLFLEKGKVVYSLKSKKDEIVVKDTTSEKRDYKIVVLIDNATASAAEILAAALKDSYGATLVGKTSYGKGKVQQTFRLSDGSMAKYTSAKWYRPKGECIDNKGIVPDVDVELVIETDKDENVINIQDTQLEKAIELLS